MQEIKSINIRSSTWNNKRAMAEIEYMDGSHHKDIHFGSLAARGKTFYDNKKLKEKRKNYIARHGAQKHQDWNDLTPAMFARYILWEHDKSEIKKLIKSELKGLYSVKDISVNLPRYKLKSLIDFD